MSDPRREARVDTDMISKLGDLAATAGLRRVAILAWRDLDDPEAGGSELHASRVASLWAEAGIEVTMRTSYAAGHPQVTWRGGYRVIRKAGRYLVFPRAAFSEMMGWHGASDGLVEIWNGMPFFSPLWARRPTVAWLHHVHDSMWEMTLTPGLARLGRRLEFNVAPLVYRRTPIVTLSNSSKDELVRKLHLRPQRITVVPPGIDPSFSPGGTRSATPLVVAVGRLVPVKRFDALVDTLAEVRRRQPALRAVIVGEGYQREALEAQIHELGAESWISLPGRIEPAALLDLYRSAWILASASAHEGWGMTITEAAACGTTAVATRIAGHADAIVHERTGLLVDDPIQMGAAIERLITDDALRGTLAASALSHATRFTWGATARGTRGARQRSSAAPPVVSNPSPPAADEAEPARRNSWSRAAIGYAFLALAAYLPVLRSDTGKVAADTKQYLYLDPARLLARAPSMWDPHIGMGTVTHQNIGYLFPMGPYYWVLDKLGVPDWVAQRLWLGTILFGAGVGVLYLLRTFGLRGPGVVVAAVAYMFTPYSLDYSARISVLLLPWAALPWMIGLTRKALRDGGWLYPAIFALVIQVIGGVNATALIFAGVGPVLWIAYAWLVDRQVDWRRALGVTLRIGALTLVTSLWWIAGLEMQGTYGLDILKYTETVRAVATASFPNEILRGLGYWFFYGSDRIGPWIEASSRYTQRPAVLLAGYGLVVIGLLAAGVLRWRHRLFFVALLIVGMIIAVGPSPYTDPTPLGAVFKAFASSSSAGLALRSTGRAVPLVVLALSVLLGLGLNAGVRSLRKRGHSLIGAGMVAVVLLLVFVNLPALVDGSFYGKNLERPEQVPAYWTQATKHLDTRGDTTRVLEEPGADFAAYGWGNTVDPITPGLMNRAYVARELIPYGTAGTADLLNAFDRRFQEGVADRSGVVSILRRMGVGDVVLRNDIQYQRYDLVRPRELNRVFAQIPGLGRPVVFGVRSPASVGKPPAPGTREEDEIDLSAPADEPLLNPVVVYPVEGPMPIVRAESSARGLMIDGDGEGLIDAADVGLLTGAGVTRYSAWYPTPAALRAALAADTALVVTDQNRMRARIWSSVRDNVGYTEQRGEKPVAEDPSDARLPLFPGAAANTYTTTQQRGIKTIQASSYGNTITYTPEDRAARALDGDPTTAWRAAALGKAVGQFIRLQLDRPITTDHVNLVQPLNGGRNRWITKVDLIFDGRITRSVVLDASSRAESGQTISFGTRRFQNLEIRVTGVSDPRRRLFGGADGVGFAEIRLRDARADHDVRVDEVVQMPQDLLDAVGRRSGDHPMVLVMTRDALRPVPPRTDPELAIARTFDLPESRTFALTGRASVNPGANDAAINAALGVPSVVTAEGSESLLGCLQCHAASAADGDPSTAWNTPFVGVGGQWVQFVARRPLTFSHMDLQVVADGRHSVPTAVQLQVDNAVRDLVIPAGQDGTRENATRTVRVRFPTVTGRRIRVTVTAVRPQIARRQTTGDTVAAPAAIAELGIPGLRMAPAPAAMPGDCRSDLLTIDGHAVPVRVTGPSRAAARLNGLPVTPCDPRNPRRVPTITLARGPHVVRTSEGVRTGVQLDRLVLGSAAGGEALAVSDGRVTGLGSAPPSAPRVTMVHNGATRMRVHVSGAETPFWLVLGESQSDGWKATIAQQESLGRSHLVDGYANGWLVKPTRDSFDVVLEWTPQRRVWAALWISVVAAMGCLGIAAWGLVRRRAGATVTRTDDAADSRVWIEWPVPSSDADRRALRPAWRRVALPLLAGLAAALILAPWAGILVLLLLFAMQWRPWMRAILVLAPAVLLALVTAYMLYVQHHFRFPPVFEWPTLFPLARPLGWLAVVFLGVDAVYERVRAGPDP